MIYSLFIGRFQPFHDGHAAIVETLLGEGKNVLIAIRNTERSPENPYTAGERVETIRSRFRHQRRVRVIVIPDIEEMVYGREVGYTVREMRMAPDIEAISATRIRAKA